MTLNVEFVNVRPFNTTEVGDEFATGMQASPKQPFV